MNSIENIAKSAKVASINALKLSTELKNIALYTIVHNLQLNKNKILEANKLDLINASSLLEKGEITQAVFNRLKLDDNKLRDMIQGIKDVAALIDPINKILWSKEIADGITLKKVSCPIGVIGVIFEARPDVITQITALSIKSSNAVILKGGIEAVETNKTLFDIIKTSLCEVNGFPDNMVNLIYTRDDVKEMLNLDEYINLIIPRGSNSLVKYIKSNTKIPVLGHADGICHIYTDEYADIEKAVNIIIDSKCQYPAACNSVETVLIHKNISDKIMNKLINALNENNVKIILDKSFNIDGYQSADENDWKTEYGDKILSIKLVNSIDEAIDHINKYGSGHTDCIVSENKENAEKFMMFVDSAGVYHNISTRFADGFRYGFGAEVGISTNKTHARGPVGLEGLTIYKYKLYGSGDIVEDFISGKRKFNK